MRSNSATKTVYKIDASPMGKQTAKVGRMPIETVRLLRGRARGKPAMEWLSVALDS